MKQLHRFVLGLYSGLWWMLRPLLKRHKRLRGSIPKRLVPSNWASPADIWLQAASGGEAYLAWEVLKAFPRGVDSQGPVITRILVTTWTDQGLEILNNMRMHLAYERPDLHIETAFFPFDERPLMQRALRMVRPKIMALLETELWPSLLEACVLYGVPVCLLNGRISPKSLRNYRTMDSFTGKLWRYLAPAYIMAMSHADATRFKELFNKTGEITSIHTAPNIKFDRAQATGSTNKATLSNPQTPLSPLLPNVPIILLASVREQEEPLLIPIIQALYEEQANALIIIAPRHMHRVNAWQALCADCPKMRLRSSLSPESPATQNSVIIWDSFGELNYLYAHSQAIFVGGSLAKLGGQNILEPLAVGKIPCTGPHLNNFLWALDLESSDSLPDSALVTICQDANAVHLALSKMLSQSEKETPKSVQARFTKWLEPRLGGTKKNAELLHNMLKQNN